MYSFESEDYKTNVKIVGLSQCHAKSLVLSWVQKQTGAVKRMTLLYVGLVSLGALYFTYDSHNAEAHNKCLVTFH